MPHFLDTFPHTMHYDVRDLVQARVLARLKSALLCQNSGVPIGIETRIITGQLDVGPIRADAGFWRDYRSAVDARVRRVLRKMRET